MLFQACLVSLSFVTLMVTAQEQAPVTTPPFAPSNPTPPSSTPGAGVPVRVALIKPWGDGSASGWATLASGWSSFGSTPLQFDYTFATNTTVTYAGLVAQAADVLVFGDCAGGLKSFSPSEIADIERYALDGHDLVGTFATFYWDQSDNRALAPLFGLVPTEILNAAPSIVDHFAVPKLWHPLFHGLGTHSWNSSGYAFSQGTSGGIWNDTDLNGARIFAQADGFKGVVTYYRHPRYNAVYFSNMPEFGGNSSDLQLLYNALTLNALSASPVKHP
ncbi:MAG: hypothetical protein L6Q99_09915 [Planctomycetes bacterium]|nr:hypothetical protein [Planctomycetota bacterium]